MKFNRKGIYIASTNLADKFKFERYINYTSKNYGPWTITFWQDRHKNIIQDKLKICL